MQADSCLQGVEMLCHLFLSHFEPWALQHMSCLKALFRLLYLEAEEWEACVSLAQNKDLLRNVTELTLRGPYFDWA